MSAVAPVVHRLVPQPVNVGWISAPVRWRFDPLYDWTLAYRCPATHITERLYGTQLCARPQASAAPEHVVLHQQTLNARFCRGHVRW
jgi:hypothetical protein